MNLSVQDNKVKYTPLQTLQDGVHYCAGTHTNVFKYSISVSTTNGQVNHNMINNRPYINCVLQHIYGSITRSDLTDGVAYYQILNSDPSNDPTNIIPVNPCETVTTFDYYDVNMIQETNYNSFWLICRSNNSNNNEIASTYTIKINVDLYCL